jgi:hypothetical protein
MFCKQLSHFNALNEVLSDLIARGLVDPNRIGITGLSDGAENVVYALIHSSKFAAAAVGTLIRVTYQEFVLWCANAKSIAARTAVTCATRHCSGVVRGLSG